MTDASLTLAIRRQLAQVPLLRVATAKKPRRIMLPGLRFIETRGSTGPSLRVDHIGTLLRIAFRLAIGQPIGAARLGLRLRAAGRIDREQQVAQERRRLRTDRPVELVGEVVGIGIDGLCEGLALCRIGRLDDGSTASNSS